MVTNYYNIVDMIRGARSCESKGRQIIPHARAEVPVPCHVQYVFVRVLAYTLLLQSY
jgi:hypothetical protein